MTGHYSEEWWATSTSRRCVSRKKGRQCLRPAIDGGTVCYHHGGAAPQVKRKARQRLEEAADRMARELLKMATDHDISDSTKLAAIRDALDRAGVSAKQALELSAASTEPKPYEELLMGISGIATISRADHYAERGLPALDQPALPSPSIRELPARTEEVVDAELVEPAAEPVFSGPDGAADVRTASRPPEVPADQPQLVSMEEAVTETRVRQFRRVTRRYR